MGKKLEFKEKNQPDNQPIQKSTKPHHKKTKKGSPKAVKYDKKKGDFKFPGMSNMSGMKHMSRDISKGLNLNLSSLK